MNVSAASAVFLGVNRGKKIEQRENSRFGLLASDAVMRDLSMAWRVAWGGVDEKSLLNSTSIRMDEGTTTNRCIYIAKEVFAINDISFGPVEAHRGNNVSPKHQLLLPVSFFIIR